MSNQTNVGDVQAPDLESMIDDAVDRIEGQPAPEVTEATVVEAEVPVSTVPTTAARKGQGAMVRLLPSMKHKALAKGQHNAGMETFEVPDKEAQLAGFYLHNAAKFVPQFRQFGFVQELGGPKNSVEI